MAIPANKV